MADPGVRFGPKPVRRDVRFAPIADLVPKHDASQYARMVSLFVGVTDQEWFDYLSVAQPDEVNFWRPAEEPISGHCNQANYSFSNSTPLETLSSVVDRRWWCVLARLERAAVAGLGGIWSEERRRVPSAIRLRIARYEATTHW